MRVDENSPFLPNPDYYFILLLSIMSLHSLLFHLVAVYNLHSYISDINISHTMDGYMCLLNEILSNRSVKTKNCIAYELYTLFKSNNLL